MLKALVLSFALSFAGAAQANVCFSNVAGHKAAKNQIPAVIRTLPLMFGIDSSLLAAIKIQASGSNLMIEGWMAQGGTGSRQKQKIQKVCVNGTSVVVDFQLESGAKASYNLVADGNAVLLEGFRLEKVSAARYKQLADRVAGMMH